MSDRTWLVNTAESEPSRQIWKTEPWLDWHQRPLKVDLTGPCSKLLKFPAMELIERAEDLCTHPDLDEREEARVHWLRANREFWDLRNAKLSDDGVWDTSDQWKEW